MQVGLISDIHGNRAALDAVWNALTALGLSHGTVLNAGDNVGGGDAPEACARFLRSHPNILTVQGNYDKNVALFPQKSAQFEKKWVRSRPEKYEALRDGSAAISGETRAWLLSLPKEIMVTLAGTRILLTHYAPGIKEGLGSGTGEDRLRELAAQTDAAVVVCGHTHSPFVRRAGAVLFVNPGSVGRSYNDSLGSYAILTLDSGRPPEAVLKEIKI